MTLTSACLTLGYCLVSACGGYLAAIVVCRRRSDLGAVPGIAAATGQPSSDGGKHIESLMRSLDELTSQVDSQVGQHSLRVSEITDSLDQPNEDGSSMVQAAGKMLITANEQLQADLVEAKSEIQRQREQMSVCMEESRTDALTGLPNRRAFDHEMNRVFAQRRRDGSSFSLLFLDIDHFKRFNDQHGHMVGDQVLKNFGRCLTETFRESDFVARYGGEEFVAILPRTPLEDAFRTAERVRKAIAISRYKSGELELQITTSIGVKEVATGEIDLDIIARADEALYAAKNNGRNRCCYHDGITWQSDLPEPAMAMPERGSPSEPGTKAATQVNQCATA